MRAIVAVLGLFAAVSVATAEPSFDCTKALTAMEKAICGSWHHGWLDREVAYLYAAAKKRQGGGDKSPLLESQREFTVRRDACLTDIDPSVPEQGRWRVIDDCVKRVHFKRLAELGDAAGLPQAFTAYDAPEYHDGELWITRYARKADFLISIAKSTNHHECSVQVEDASVSTAGVITWSEESPAGKCSIEIAPRGNGVDIGADCDMICGANVTVNGFYPRAK